jgi:hypothetical protein
LMFGEAKVTACQGIAPHIRLLSVASYRSEKLYKTMCIFLKCFAQKRSKVGQQLSERGIDLREQFLKIERFLETVLGFGLERFFSVVHRGEKTTTRYGLKVGMMGYYPVQQSLISSSNISMSGGF